MYDSAIDVLRNGMSSRSVDITLDTPKHHAGIVRSSAPLTVETPAAQWSYSVSIPLRGGIQPRGPLQLPVKVVTTVSVESGELGCLLIGPDWTTLLGHLPSPVGPGQHTINLLLERESPKPYLAFRNASASNSPCVFTIQSVVLSPDHGDSLQWTSSLEDVLEGTPPRIVIQKLLAAIDNRDRWMADDVTILDRLRRKWSTVPAGLMDRRSTGDLLRLSDEELREFWISTHRQATTGSGFAVRGWYQHLYRDVLRDKKVLEIGSGMGIDGIEFARHGAAITFVDIVEDNIRVMQRLCGIFGITNAQFVYLHSLRSLDALATDYDFVWSQGSQINVPFEFAKHECAIIVRHLKAGGRWIELAYPRERWVRDGSPPYRLWGNLTDGEGTPWMEWYDLERILNRLAPTEWQPLLSFNFHHDDFNWFDLVKVR
jgi:SAM-dependent methyltransferase